MGFDCNLFCEQTASAIGQMEQSAGAVSHAIGKLSEAMGDCSHVVGYSSLPVRQTTVKNVVMMSIIRKPVLKIDEIKEATITIDNAKINWDIIEKNFGRNRLWTIEED